MALPQFFTVNDRPVKVVTYDDGRIDVMALDMKTGDWERDDRYLDMALEGGRDVDLLTEDEFNAAVAAIREWLKQ
jgi:predicted RNA-binding protein associated with RNAse of E/G family